MNAQEALVGAMEEHQLRAEDVASMAGISLSTVYQVRSGGRKHTRLLINALRQIPGFSERYDANAAIAS